MIVGDVRTRWTVSAMLAPIERGATFARAAWPAHVTLASNFVVDEPARLRPIVDAALEGAGSLTARTGRLAWFGERGDVPVLLVASPAIERVHERLAQALVLLPGFAVDAPRQWRAGYRPHLTLGAAVRPPVGKEAVVTCVAVARLDGARAQIEAVLPTPSMRSADA